MRTALRRTLAFSAVLAGLVACATTGPTPAPAGRAPADGAALAGGRSPAAGPSAAGGAVAPLPVVMWFDDFNEVFEGSAFEPSTLMLATRVDVRSRVGHVRCVGRVEPRIVPPEADPPRRCEGVRGDALVTCSDTRRITVEWWSEGGCGAGYGRGQDAEGHTLHLVYGGSPTSVAKISEEALAAQASKPRPPTPQADEASGREHGISTGTAFFVTWDGYLVTNQHVVSQAKHIQVKLGDGELVDAELVSGDPDNDLALLRVQAVGRPLRVLRTEALSRGDPVFTLGYPLIQLQGQEQKATFGHINALTGLQGDKRFVQIDVPIQPGNSGGPLLNQRGEVVGVVSSMLHPLATLRLAGVVPQNVNYAIKSGFAHQMVRWKLGADWDAEVPAGESAELAQLIKDLEGSVVLVVAQ
jgi:S1-C subfamily serine protease